jgi:DNA repair protein RecO
VFSIGHIQNKCKLKVVEKVSQGLLLQAIPYLGSGRILKVFTRKEGLISLFTKTRKLGSLGSPFCIGEWVYQDGSKDLYKLKDASLVDPLLDLRTSFEAISSAGLIAQEILKSQLPSPTSPLLYELLIKYFKKLSQFTNPEILPLSFRCKLLLYEGLLSLKNTCAHCANPALCLFRGESFCPDHAPITAAIFTPLEWEQLLLLTWAPQFSLLQALEIKPPLIKKMKLILDALLQN